MPGRVLNFSEFYSKYSKEENTEKSLDSVIQAPSNFEQGFDEETYDQKEIGPNRPISGSYEETPVQPGEKDSFSFSSTVDSSMDAPKKEETNDDDSEIKLDDSDKTEVDSKDDETPEPELGANPKFKKKKKKKKKKVKKDKGEEEDKDKEKDSSNKIEESNRFLTFDQFVNEEECSKCKSCDESDGLCEGCGELMEDCIC